MDKWQQEFSGKVGALRERWARQFETFVTESLAPVYAEFNEFATRCELEASAPKSQGALRNYKFALAEDAYVLLYFRPKGVDRVEFEYECVVPGVGRVEGVKSAASVLRAGTEWVESCFHMALDELVSRYSESEVETEELVSV